MAFVPLFDPTQQFIERSGKPLVGGKLYVFLNESEDVPTVKNSDGTIISQPVILDNDGRAQGGVYVSGGSEYRLEVKDEYDALLWAVANISPMTFTENSFTDDDVTKLDSIQVGAQKNVQSDWRQANSTKDDYIKNKPQVTSITATVEDTTSAVGAADFDLTTNRVLFDETMDAGFLVPKIVTPPSDVKVLAVGAGEGGPSWKGMEDVQKHADWNCGDSTDPAFIENKPSIVQLQLTDSSGEHAVGENGPGWLEVNSQDASSEPGYVQVKYTHNHQLRTRVLGYLLPSLDAIPMKDADINVLETETVRFDAGGQVNLYVADGKAYDVVLADSNVVVNLNTYSTNTLHTVLKVSTESDSDCLEFALQWLDEALVQHRLIIPLYNTDKSFYFDVYIREVAHNSNIYSVARVSDFPCGFRTSPPVLTTRDNNTNWIGRNV